MIAWRDEPHPLTLLIPAVAAESLPDQRVQICTRDTKRVEGNVRGAITLINRGDQGEGGGGEGGRPYI